MRGDARFKGIETPKCDSSLFDGLLVFRITFRNVFVQASGISFASG
jgi:hypothetical protein